MSTADGKERRTLAQALERYTIVTLATAGIVGSSSWALIHGPAALSLSFAQVLLRNPLTWLAVIQSAWFVLQAVLWSRYQPYAPDLPDAPSLSVIIPAYNEGPMIERSCRSVARADYPHGRLEIILVDDGSRDDTYFHMERLRREFPALVKLIRFRGNRGKHAALYDAFFAARGEVVATLDSDSEIEPGTLRALVAPFQRDQRVGAVAGRVCVLNRDDWIGRMLDVQYALAFDFSRAAQSAYRTVACCPGALSAFRRAVLLPVLDEWMHRTFLGKPVLHGEDQAITNLVLRSGYDAVYQRAAVVNTVVPQRYRQLCRMLTRWDRSFVVEGLSFARFMFSSYRSRNRVLPVVHFALTNLRVLLLYAGLLEMPALLVQQPALLLKYLTAFLVGAVFAASYYLCSDRSFRFVYGVLYAFYSLFLLQWIFPWAVLTVRDDRWGTR